MRVDVLRGAQLMASTRAEIARFRHRVFVQKLGWHVPGTASTMGVVDADGTVTKHRDEDIDEYDRQDTVYVTLRGDGDAIVGCARLLPVTCRFLLGDHFRHLVDDLQAAIDARHAHAEAAQRKPRARRTKGDAAGSAPVGDGAGEHGHAGDDVGNMGDMGAAVWELSRFALEPALSDPDSPRVAEQQSARELLRAAVFTAHAMGARRLIGVTYVSLARLFKRLGVTTYRLGGAEQVDGRWVAAYRIELDATTLRALGLLDAHRP